MITYRDKEHILVERIFFKKWNNINIVKIYKWLHLKLVYVDKVLAVHCLLAVLLLH